MLLDGSARIHDTKLFVTWVIHDLHTPALNKKYLTIHRYKKKRRRRRRRRKEKYIKISSGLMNALVRKRGIPLGYHLRSIIHFKD
jgi:hypothetical protein